MRGSPTAVTEKEKLLIIRISAQSAGLELGEILIVYIFYQHRRINLGDLDSVLDGIRG